MENPLQVVDSMHRAASRKVPIESRQRKPGLDQKAMVKVIKTGCIWDTFSGSIRIKY